jgi:hypothetical protein
MIHALGCPSPKFPVAHIPALAVPPDHGFALGRNKPYFPTPGLCKAPEIRVRAEETGNGK